MFGVNWFKESATVTKGNHSPALRSAKWLAIGLTKRLTKGLTKGLTKDMAIGLAACVLVCSHACAQENVSLPRSDQKTVAASVFAPGSSPCRGIAIVSHGAGGSEAGYAYLGRALSAQGYLALVVGHRESGREALRQHMNGEGLREGLARLITDTHAYEGRFMDIAAARHWAQTRCAGTMTVLLGHSMGAATAMLEAGARNRLGLTGANRFDAYVALSPQGVGSIFTADAWRDIARPVLLMTGTRDDELGGAGWQTRTEAFDSLPAGCHWLGVVDGATHMHFAGNGASATTEQLTLATIEAFLQGVTRGECRAPVPQRGLELRTK